MRAALPLRSPNIWMQSTSVGAAGLERRRLSIGRDVPCAGDAREHAAVSARPFSGKCLFGCHSQLGASVWKNTIVVQGEGDCRSLPLVAAALNNIALGD